MPTNDLIPGKDFPFIFWKVHNLSRKLPDGDVYPESCVYKAVWSCKLYDQGQSVEIAGEVELGDPDPNNYTPYSSITQEQALGWVKTILGDEKIAFLEKELEKEMQEKLNPPTKIGAPWADT